MPPPTEIGTKHSLEISLKTGMSKEDDLFSLLIFNNINSSASESLKILAVEIGSPTSLNCLKFFGFTNLSLFKRSYL